MTSSTIADVVARMREIASSSPHEDGVACFNRLYLAVTEEVDVRQRQFAAPEFLALLDVRFADLYFEAFAKPPRAWRPLFEARGRSGIAPIQFALAGMNAHINRDLPVALVETCRELGIDLRRGGPEHADFLTVNRLLFEVEARVKRELATGPIEVADKAFGHVDDAIAMWNVARARDSAWANAEALWELRRSPQVAAAFLDALDRMVGFAGRGLLRPAPHQPLARRVWRRVRSLL
jgi:hypothetical protein